MTAQMREIVTIDGAEHEMCTLPLAPWLAVQTPPLNMERICPSYSSALWRRYVGHWRITEENLFLDRLGTVEESRDIDMGEIFAGRAGPIAADWFSGKLRLPGEPELIYVHMGWGSFYRYERIIHIQAGRVVRERHVDHTARFLAYCETLTRSDIEYPENGEERFGLRGLTWLTEEGRALVTAHLGIVFPTDDSDQDL
jgi:hypothetical protein